MNSCQECGAEARRKFCGNACRQKAYRNRTILIRGKKNSEARTIEELLYVLRFYVNEGKINKDVAEEYVRVLLTLYQDDRNVTL